MLVEQEMVCHWMSEQIRSHLSLFVLHKLAWCHLIRSFAEKREYVSKDLTNELERVLFGSMSAWDSSLLVERMQLIC